MSIQLQQMRWVRIATLLLFAAGLVLLFFSLAREEAPPQPPEIALRVVDASDGEAARLQSEADRLAWEARLTALEEARQARILLFAGISVAALCGFLLTFTVKQTQNTQARRPVPLPPR